MYLLYSDRYTSMFRFSILKKLALKHYIYMWNIESQRNNNILINTNRYKKLKLLFEYVLVLLSIKYLKKC